MKIKFSIMAVAFILASAFSVHAAAPPFESVLPEDTFLCISIDSMKTFYKNAKDHPLYQLAQNKAFVKLLSSLPGKAESDQPDQNDESFAQAFEKEMGIKPERLPELFPGQWLLAMTDADLAQMAAAEESGNADDLPMTLILSHSGDTAAIKSMIFASARYDEKNEGAKHRIIEETYHGARLFHEETEKDNVTTDAGSYALLDDVLILTRSKERAREMVIRFKDVPENSFYTGKRFAKIRPHLKNTGAYVYLNFEKPAAMLAEAAKKKAAAANRSSESKGPMDMVSPELILQTLNPGAFEGFFLGADIHPDTSRISSGLLLKNRTGLASLLQFENKSPQQPAYVPDTVVSASVSRFDIGTALNNMEGLLAQALPFVNGMYQGYLAQIKANSGVDLRADLIANLGSEMTIINMPIESSASKKPGQDPFQQVIAIGIKDKQGFEMALDGIKSMLGASENFEKTDYLGQTLYRFKSAPGTGGPALGGFSYMITDDTVFFCTGPATGLQRVLSYQKKPARLLWDKAVVRKAKKLLPAGNVAFSYTDLDTMMDALITGLASFKTTGADKSSDADIEQLKKQIAFPFYLIFQTYSEENGIFYKGVLLEKEK